MTVYVVYSYGVQPFAHPKVFTKYKDALTYAVSFCNEGPVEIGQFNDRYAEVRFLYNDGYKTGYTSISIEVQELE